MKKNLLIGLALILGLALALPVWADVTVTATVDKDKDVRVIETLTKTKIVTIDIDVDINLPGAAESLTLVNQSVEDVTVDQEPVCEDIAPPAVLNSNTRLSLITGSINDNTGIIGVNQDSGVANNQGNAYGIAVTDIEAFAEAQASADQKTLDNDVTAEGTLGTTDPAAIKLLPPQKMDKLIDSVWRNTGLTGVNQSVGNANNQLNALSMGVGLITTSTVNQGVYVALAEADLGQVTSNNRVLEIATIKWDLILNSINSNNGITNVNQSAGNMNNQANVVSLAVQQTQ